MSGTKTDTEQAEFDLAIAIINELVDEENAAIDGPPCNPADHTVYYGTFDGRPSNCASCTKCHRFLRRVDAQAPWTIYGVREHARRIEVNNQTRK